MSRKLSATLLALAAVLSITPAILHVRAQGLDPATQRGAVFVKTHCANCHAIGRTGVSRLKEAPPFRHLGRRYPVEELAEAFAEGIVTGHPSMPEWQLDPGQVSDLVAYLKWVQPERARGR